MNDFLKGLSRRTYRQEEGSQKAGGETMSFAQRWRKSREWLRVHGRRAAHAAHIALVGNYSGPISYLCVAGVLGVVMTLTTLYTPSYAVLVDGEEVGIVAKQQVVEDAIQQIEQVGTTILGYDFELEGEVDYQFGLALRSEITETNQIKNHFYRQLDDVSSTLRRYELIVDGEVLGSMDDRDALEGLLQELKDQYTTEDTTSVEFMEPVSINHVYTDDGLLTADEMRLRLTENATGETTYTVQQGDTFNAIAYDNDMSVSDMKALNPNVNINRLMIGDVLNVKEVIPRLSVQTIENVTYTEAIPCPVEEVEDSSMYKGNSKILVQGEEGEALVNAIVTRVNGRETERDIQSSRVLREATTTTKAVGTKERPKTASTGSYQWPVRGRITSYFGGRYIFGSYSYHSGIDISCSYGAAIKAADGGIVTFAGYKGTYGYLVIITHDNGAQTYYAHNSSLLVSAGTKVYKGQQIAKAGSTGRSTGVHCHFEVRIRGASVNPLSYLP